MNRSLFACFPLHLAKSPCPCFLPQPKLPLISIARKVTLHDKVVYSLFCDMKWLVLRQNVCQHLSLSRRMPSTNAPKMEKGSVSNVVNFYPVFEDPSTAKAKISKSKKYRNNLPRPFSPIFTNVNFYETQSRLAFFIHVIIPR